jgi:hypothetical protein
VSGVHPHHPLKPFAIPADWTAEQAMTVIDLLDELRTHIWAKYEISLLDAYREDLRPPPAADEQALPFVDDELF